LLLIAYLPGSTYFDIAWRMALAGAGFGLFLGPNARLSKFCTTETGGISRWPGIDHTSDRANARRDAGRHLARNERRRPHTRICCAGSHWSRACAASRLRPARRPPQEARPKGNLNSRSGEISSVSAQWLEQPDFGESAVVNSG
jgi:hypothetical protein